MSHMSSIESIIAVNRFGMGAAPGEVAAVGADARAWLAAQVAKPAPMPAQLAKLPDSGEALQAYPRWIASLARARNVMAGDQGAQPTVESTFRQQMGPAMVEEVGAKLTAAAASEAPFQERLAWFWANHFAVSAEKALVFALVGSFEREA